MSTVGLTIDEANNFMALEPHLVERLQAAVAGMSPAVHVLTAAELAEVAESKQLTPALHLVYGGYRIADDLGNAWRLEHTWFAVACCRSAAMVRSGSKARQDAGLLATKAALALADAQVPGAAAPLTLITPPAPSHTAPYFYLPTAVRAVTHFLKPPED
jgi:hypothetical protein